MMDKIERQYALLRAVVEEYIRSAKPVSSNTLVSEYGFHYSPATIRNDLALLESAGLIVQPHTSAGRVPTEKGYQFYIQNFITTQDLAPNQKKHLQQADSETTDSYRRIKKIAKAVSDLTNEAVIVSHNEDSFFTGLSNITKKPDFAQRDALVALSEMFDQLDDVMSDIEERMSEQVQIFIGEENPLSATCSIVLTSYQLPDRTIGVLGILGPMRMDYATNVAVIQYVDDLIEDNE